MTATKISAITVAAVLFAVGAGSFCYKLGRVSEKEERPILDVTTSEAKKEEFKDPFKGWLLERFKDGDCALTSINDASDRFNSFRFFAFYDAKKNRTDYLITTRFNATHDIELRLDLAIAKCRVDKGSHADCPYADTIRLPANVSSSTGYTNDKQIITLDTTDKTGLIASTCFGEGCDIDYTTILKDGRYGNIDINVTVPYPEILKPYRDYEYLFDAVAHLSGPTDAISALPGACVDQRKSNR